MSIDVHLIQNAKIASAHIVDKAGCWLGSLRLKGSQWLQNLDLTPDKMIEAGSYLGIGFFVGFLFKKYFHMFLMFIILLIGAIWVLGEFDLIVVNWSNAQDIANVTPQDTISTIISNYTHWIKQNILIVISGLAGFIIGYKVG